MESEFCCSLPEQKDAQKRAVMGEKGKREGKTERKERVYRCFPEQRTQSIVCVCLCARTLVCVLGVRGNGVAVWGRQEVRMIVGEWGRGKEKKRQMGNSP